MATGGDEVTYSTVPEEEDSDEVHTTDIDQVHRQLRASGDQLALANDNGRRLQAQLRDTEEQLRRAGTQSEHLRRDFTEVNERLQAALASRAQNDDELQTQTDRAKLGKCKCAVKTTSSF